MDSLKFVTEKLGNVIDSKIKNNIFCVYDTLRPSKVRFIENLCQKYLANVCSFFLFFFYHRHFYLYYPTYPNLKGETQLDLQGIDKN